MNEHRIISNEIADIKASSFELSKEQKQRISFLLKSKTKMPVRAIRPKY